MLDAIKIQHKFLIPIFICFNCMLLLLLVMKIRSTPFISFTRTYIALKRWERHIVLASKNWIKLACNPSSTSFIIHLFPFGPFSLSNTQSLSSRCVMWTFKIIESSDVTENVLLCRYEKHCKTTQLQRQTKK